MVQIFFHGTRGSFPISSKTHTKYGGHTSCVSILFDNQWFILDAGSGLIDAPSAIQNKNIKRCHLFLSHLHLDHIIGLPAFPLSWDPTFEINLYCGMSLEFKGLKNALNTIFAPPYFPVKWDDFKARRLYKDFVAGESLQLNDTVSMKTIFLNHPGGACGYKLIVGNRSIVYLSDTSHEKGMFEKFIKFAKYCDLLIYDSTYCDSEFSAVAEYGHSTWQIACDLANKSSAKQLALFHHDPSHTDEFINGMEIEARLKFPNTFAATCGMNVEI
ncbi:MAG: MBL fold metallo-hydrolase [Candidatus Paracaedibacteraceae bacterium]|nr:MBL fold metallo-hydrolase [Candidatus Paracaedibacteraceae bacterium]